MSDNPLESLSNYSHFIAGLLNRPTVEHSTLSVWSDSPYTGIAEGDIFFKKKLRGQVIYFPDPILDPYFQEIIG